MPRFQRHIPLKPLYQLHLLSSPNITPGLLPHGKLSERLRSVCSAQRPSNSRNPVTPYAGPAQSRWGNAGDCGRATAAMMAVRAMARLCQQTIEDIE